MAKGRTDTESVLKLVIDGKQAKTSVNELRDTYYKLNAEINELKKSDNPKLYAQKRDEVQKLERAWKEAREEIRGASKDAVSFKDQLVDLAKEAAGRLTVAGGVYAVINGVKTMIQKNAELSDSMAGVMKTTGLSEEAVDRLNEKFKKMDTRTANTQLLELAQVAGKLGYAAENDVLAFVSAADKIGVALGEDLGGVEESVNSLGKLVNIFKINESFGLEESLLKVGSAINTLGASGTANEKNLIDFAQRLAGVAPAANISLPQVLALGAVMDELGQRMETSSTAVGQFLVQIGSDVPKYAKIAGMSVKEFSKLLATDGLEAFLKVIEGAKSTKAGVEGLAESMGILEVSGSGGVQSLGAIAKNLELVRQRSGESNESFIEGTSVLEEFNTANTNLAANLEKIWNRINTVWENSTFRNWMTELTSAMLGNNVIANDLVDTYNRQVKANDSLNNQLDPLIKKYDELQIKGRLNAQEQNEMRTVIQQIADILPNAVTGWDSLGNAMDIHRVKVLKLTTENNRLLQSQKDLLIQDLQDGFKNSNDFIQEASSSINDFQRTISKIDSGDGFDLFGIRKWYNEKNRNATVGMLEAPTKQAYAYVKQLQAAGVALNDEQTKILRQIEGFQQAVDVKLPGKGTGIDGSETTGGGSTGATGTGKGKSKADKAKEENERIEADNKKHLERLLKEEELFSANQLINQKSTHEKELAQLGQTFEKEISKWEEFKTRKGVTAAQVAEADGKMAELAKDKEKAVQDLRLKQEKEYLDGVAKLREELGTKHETELDKERNRINAHYDKLKTDFAGNTEMLKQIELDRIKDLADAKKRGEQSLSKETDRIRNINNTKDLSDLDRKRNALKSQYENDVAKLKEKYNAEQQATIEFQTAMMTLKQGYIDADENLVVEAEKAKQQQLKDMAIGAAQSIADSVFSIVSQNIQAESNARISGLEAQRDKELSNKNLTEKQKAKIQDKYDKQIAAEKLRAWKAQKRADILSATINTALAVTKALPNWILAAAAGIAGAAQIAVIAAQKPPQFERGGFIPKGSRHSQGGINLIDSRSRTFVGNIEGGEPILSRNTYANNREIVDALLYTSQRQNGARIRMNPDAISAEQWVRNGGSAFGASTPVVNVSAPGTDTSEMVQLLQIMVDKLDKPKSVVLSKRLLEDDAEDQVRLNNRVNG